MDDKILNNLDINAQIIPGYAAAGLILGMKIELIKKQLLDSLQHKVIDNKFVINSTPIHEYRNTDTVLYFSNDILVQIGLIGNYKGKLDCRLGLGDLARDFEALYGQIIEGDEDQLTFKNIKGLCFDVDYSSLGSDNWAEEIPNLPVTHIFVYQDKG